MIQKINNEMIQQPEGVLQRSKELAKDIVEKTRQREIEKPTTLTEENKGTLIDIQA